VNTTIYFNPDINIFDIQLLCIPLHVSICWDHLQVIYEHVSGVIELSVKDIQTIEWNAGWNFRVKIQCPFLNPEAINSRSCNSLFLRYERIQRNILKRRAMVRAVENCRGFPHGLSATSAAIARWARGQIRARLHEASRMQHEGCVGFRCLATRIRPLPFLSYIRTLMENHQVLETRHETFPSSPNTKRHLGKEPSWESPSIRRTTSIRLPRIGTVNLPSQLSTNVLFITLHKSLHVSAHIRAIIRCIQY
jgi:hypothetical protein